MARLSGGGAELTSDFLAELLSQDTAASALTILKDCYVHESLNRV